LRKLQPLEARYIDWATEAHGRRSSTRSLRHPVGTAAPPYDGAELRAVIAGLKRRLGGLRINSVEVDDDWGAPGRG